MAAAKETTTFNKRTNSKAVTKRKKQRYPTCIFCRRDDSEPSLEDVFAKWIAREFPDGKLSKFAAEGGYRGRAPDVKCGTRGHLGLVTTGACKRCNNEWMSNLETKVKPIFRPLMRGVETTIPTDHQHTIAQWAVKTAIMYEYRESKIQGTARYFKPLDRLAMFKSLTIPNHTWIFAGHYIGQYALWVRNDSSVQLNIHFEGQRSDFPAYSMTFAIGQLALQLFSFRWPVDSGTRAIKFGLPGEFPKATVKIWPAIAEKPWPPELKFDDTAMDDFATTWRTLRTD